MPPVVGFGRDFQEPGNHLITYPIEFFPLVDGSGRFCLAKTPGVLYRVGLHQVDSLGDVTLPGHTVDLPFAWPSGAEAPPIADAGPKAHRMES